MGRASSLTAGALDIALVILFAERWGLIPDKDGSFEKDCNRFIAAGT
jgi:hypothetical protein